MAMKMKRVRVKGSLRKVKGRGPQIRVKSHTRMVKVKR